MFIVTLVKRYIINYELRLNYFIGTKMKIDINENKLAYIIDAIKPHMGLNDGKATFSGNGLDEYCCAILGLIQIKEKIRKKIPAETLVKIVHRAVFNITANNSLTPIGYKEEINKLLNNYLKKRKQEFIIQTGLYLNRKIRFNSIRSNGLYFRFNKKLDLSLLLQHNNFFPFENLLQKNYLPVLITCEGYCEYTAYENAINEFDYLRALWNLHLNLRIHLKVHNGVSQPLNHILKLPFSTIHLKNGSLFKDMYWYDETHDNTQKLKSLTQSKYSDIKATEKKMRLMISKLPHSEIIKNALVKYVRSLDDSDYNNSLVQLWSLLEYLTFTGSESYDVTIKRASSIYHDRKMNQMILEHFRNLRNANVHLNKGIPNIEINLCILKRQVESLLLFHIEQGHLFKNKEEIKEFLDLPVDEDNLRKKIRLCKTSLKLRKM